MGAKPACLRRARGALTVWERGTDWGLLAPVPWGPGLLLDWGDHGSGQLLSPAPWSQAPWQRAQCVPGPVLPVQVAPPFIPLHLPTQGPPQPPPFIQAPPARPGPPGHPHSSTSTCPPRARPATPIHPGSTCPPRAPQPGEVGALSACPLRSAVLVNTSPGCEAIQLACRGRSCLSLSRSPKCHIRGCPLRPMYLVAPPQAGPWHPSCG